MQRVHFIAIGGSAMHNLAIALHDSGYDVSGSDDEIFDPSKGRLAAKGLLPATMGWNPEANIHSNLDAVILGMHAKADNPELLKAKHLGLKIYSYPEFIYEHSKNKQRVVIAGSHGKTTITGMILHVMRYCNKPVDYMVGAQLDGFTNMVHLSDAPVIIIEGDEYLASPIDRVPKFMHYKHHIAVVSGIAWDHINVFPTFENYKEQFEMFINATPKSGVLIYNEDDKNVAAICKPIKREDLIKVEYTQQKSKIKDGITYLLHNEERYPVPYFGDHNLYNTRAAFEVCTRIGVSETDFFKALGTFKGAANRLELLASGGTTFVYKDFAHAPSKLEATTAAVSKQYPKHTLIACIELHTFSSLNKAFLSQYKNTLDKADVAVVYFNPQTLVHKRLEPITEDDIRKAFNKPKLNVFTDSNALQQFLKNQPRTDAVVLLMSSGNFDGIRLKEFAQELIK